MIKELPDKWVRKAVSDALSGLTFDNVIIDGVLTDNVIIPCYDTRVTITAQQDYPQHYILMITQSNDVDYGNKCEDLWESQILIEVFTSYDSRGNTGSRLLADNILNEAKNATNNLTLDVASGLKIQKQTNIFPNDLSITTKKEIVYRKFLRLEFVIS